MKKAGDLLGAFFDERMLSAARGYTELFSAWKSLVGEKIAAHSRIAELDKAILVVEADHPGWMQILQTKQASILEGARKRFPQLSISGISFRLAKGGSFTEVRLPDRPKADAAPAEKAESLPTDHEPAGEEETSPRVDPYAAIADESFRDLLVRLEKSIKTRNKTR